MKTLALKIKNYPRVNIVNNYNLEKRILNSLLVFLGVLALAYVFFLGNTVFNIVERRGLETEARAILNEVGSLEAEYLAISSQIDVSLAESIGFKETKNRYYAVRKSLGSIKIVQNDL